MNNCDKKKKKALLGFFLIVLIAVSGVLKQHNMLDVPLEYGLAFVLIGGVFAAILSTPYIKCLSDYNKSHKPPFSK